MSKALATTAKGQIVHTKDSDELARRANHEHDLVAASANTLREGAEGMVGHAIAAGEALNQVRQSIPHGEWRKWLEANFTASYDTARIYMRFADNRLALAGISTYQEALGVVKQISRATKPTKAEKATRMREARRLVKDGFGKQIVAERYGVSKATVDRWCDPKQMQRAAAYQREAKAALRKVRQEKAAESFKGQPVGDAYALVRRAAKRLDQARRRETKTSVLAALTEATENLYLVEDKLGETLRKMAVR